MDQSYNEKRYQVFISSTYEDLKGARSRVIEALLDNDYIPAAMEYFPASDDDPTSYIEGILKHCDYYVLIIGGRFGSTMSDGRSYTEMEYEVAVQLKIPVISFIRDIDKIPSGQVDSGEPRKKLQGFIEKVKKQKLYKSWNTEAELGLFVQSSLSKIAKQKPRPGWVRANTLSQEHALLLQEYKDQYEYIEKLRSKIEALKKDGPIQVFDDFDVAWHESIKRTLIDDIEKKKSQGERVRIRVMGVCLHKSFPRLAELLLTKKDELDISGVRIELRFSILDRNCGSWKKLEKLDSQWSDLMNAFDKQMEKFINKIQERPELNISIKLTQYRHMPNYHGLMLNKQDLFVSDCMWFRDGNLTVGRNPYKYFAGDVSEHHNYMLRLYTRWFDFGRYSRKGASKLLFESRKLR